MGWQSQAGCKGYPVDWWYPEGIDPAADRAKMICAGCPVRDECLSWAMSNGEPWGIWGGLDEEERRALRRTNVLVLT